MMPSSSSASPPPPPPTSPTLLKNRRRESAGLPSSMVSSIGSNSVSSSSQPPRPLRPSTVLPSSFVSREASSIASTLDEEEKKSSQEPRKRIKEVLFEATDPLEEVDDPGDVMIESSDDSSASNNNENEAGNNDAEENKPLTRRASSANPVMVEESELLDDTFTFLMAAKYPLEEICGCYKRGEYSKSRATEDEPSEYFADSSITSSHQRFIGVDPDAWYLPFWTGTFVILSQLFIYAVVIANVFRSNIPPNADRLLRLAQIFAVLVTLYTQGDFIDGLFLMSERWKAFAEITTPIKFNLSAIFRLVAGNVGILATFMLVMYSTEVVDMLLNFTAMEFVATLDDSAFELAVKGFLGVTLEKKCYELQNFRYIRRFRTGLWTRIFVYGFYVFVVFGAFLTIVSLQAAREVGIENEVYVQFDDSNVPELFGISGVYHGCKLKRTKKIGGIGYVGIADECPKYDRKDKNPEFPAKTFIYCWDLQGWVYITEPTTTPCEKESHLMRSFLEDAIDANSFDLLTNAKANWILSRGDKVGGEALLPSFFIDSVQSFEDGFVNCGENGFLSRSDKPLETQRPFQPLPEIPLYYPTFEDATYRKAFGLSYRPIFTREIKWQYNRHQVVIFNGLRWEWLALNPRAFAQNISKEEECPNEDDDPDCWRVFVKYFRRTSAWRFNFTVALASAISDPMMFLSTFDTGVPTDALKWYETRLVDGQVLPGKEYVNGDIPIGYECATPVQFDCKQGETQFVLEYTTDFYPEETHFLAFFGQGTEDIAGLSTAVVQLVPSTTYQFAIPEADGLIDLRFTAPETQHVFGTCIPKSQPCVQLVVLDTFGDGITEPGQYSIAYGFGGEAVDSDNTMPFSCRSYEFGDGCENVNASASQPIFCDSTSITEDDYPAEVVGADSEADPFFAFFDLNATREPLSDTFETFNPDGFSTSVPTDNLNGFLTQVPTFELLCAPDEIELTFQLTTDFHPTDTAIITFFGQRIEDAGDLSTAYQATVTSRTGSFEPLAAGELMDLRFGSQKTAYVIGTCVPTSIPCTQVFIADSFGDGIGFPGGYQISFGVSTIYDFETPEFDCRSYRFGEGCTNPTAIPEFCSYSDILELYPLNIVPLEIGDGSLGQFSPNPWTIAPTNFGTVDSTGYGGGFATIVPTFELFCSPSEIAFSIQFTTDDFPSETSIRLFAGRSVRSMGSLSAAYQITASSVTGTFAISDSEVLTDLRFRLKTTAYSLGTCVSAEIPCVQVVLLDTARDGIFEPGGYEFSFGESNLVIGDNDGFECRSYEFGPGCVGASQVPSRCSLDDVSTLYPSNVVEFEIDGVDGSDPSTAFPTNLGSFESSEASTTLPTSARIR